jgi:hypothetical protein
MFFKRVFPVFLPLALIDWYNLIPSGKSLLNFNCKQIGFRLQQCSLDNHLLQ